MTKLAHQPFEDWLLSGETLSAEQTAALQDHLQICDTCSELQAAWSSVRAELRAAPMATPVAGFSQRWQANLARERRLIQRRQTLLVMLFSVGGAVMLFITLGLALSPYLRMPMPVLLALVYQATAVVSMATSTAEIIQTLGRTVFSLLPWPVWIGIAMMMGMLFLTWIFAMKRLIPVWRATE